MADALDFAIDLSTVVERLEQLTYFVSVGDIQAATEAIEDEYFQPPAAFVSIASETAQPNRFIRGSGAHSQEVDVVLSVVFAEQVERAAADTRDRVELTRKAVIRQLIGWTPGRAGRARDYDRYLLRGMSGRVVWGECLFRTRYRLDL